jgi:hypothetical protein
MTNLKLKLTTGLVTAAFFAGVVAPAGAFAANNVTVKGNGAGSYNKVNISSNSVYKVDQSNETLVVNGVLVAQNTGMNEANQNTGGAGSDPSVDSGNADATVTNVVTTGSNVLNP